VRTFLRHKRWPLAMGAGSDADLLQHYRLEGDGFGTADVSRRSGAGL